jgi:hypothetical protein
LKKVSERFKNLVGKIIPNEDVGGSPEAEWG